MDVNLATDHLASGDHFQARLVGAHFASLRGQLLILNIAFHTWPQGFGMAVSCLDPTKAGDLSPRCTML